VTCVRAGCPIAVINTAYRFRLEINVLPQRMRSDCGPSIAAGSAFVQMSENDAAVLVRRSIPLAAQRRARIVDTNVEADKLEG
jgi:hypothetical protein